jgi:hypothetical protein
MDFSHNFIGVSETENVFTLMSADSNTSLLMSETIEAMTPSASLVARMASTVPSELRRVCAKLTIFEGRETSPVGNLMVRIAGSHALARCCV